MSSADVFYGIKDIAYWVFQNTLEPIGDSFWIFCIFFGLAAFGYWMWRQAQFNKIAANDPNQRK